MSALRTLLVNAIASIGMLLVSTGTPFAQVSDCTDGGCEPFAQECFQQGYQPVCLNSLYLYSGPDVEEPSKKDEHLCAVATAIMQKNCAKEKNTDQPCLVAEDRVLDRCFFVPLTLCLDPNEVSELWTTHPDVCAGTCTDTLGCNYE